MDLQTRKLNFIKDFLKLESEMAISHLEKLLEKEIGNNLTKEPMSINELQERINLSSIDAENGLLTENNILISEIEKWS